MKSCDICGHEGYSGFVQKDGREYCEFCYPKRLHLTEDEIRRIAPKDRMLSAYEVYCRVCK